MSVEAVTEIAQLLKSSVTSFMCDEFPFIDVSQSSLLLFFLGVAFVQGVARLEPFNKIMFSFPCFWGYYVKVH